MAGSQKFWFEGLVYANLSGDGSQKYWFNGLVFSGLGADITPADDLNNWSDDISVSRFAPNIDISDNANNFTDAIELILENRLLPADDLNTWSDNLEYTYLIYTVNLSVTVADNYIVTVGSAGNRYRWKDSVQRETNPFSDLDITVDDLEAFLSDEAVVISDELIEISDSFTLTDVNSLGFGLSTETFDSLQYFLQDTLSYFFTGELINTSVSDNLNNWLDEGTAARNIATIEPSDIFTLSDFIVISGQGFQNFSDSFTLADALTTLSFGLNLTESDVTDLSNWLDSVAISINQFSDVSVGNSLNNWSDTISVISNVYAYGNLLDYIRRYLNDIVSASAPVIQVELLDEVVGDSLYNFLDESTVNAQIIPLVLVITDDLSNMTDTLDPGTVSNLIETVAGDSI